MPFLIKLNYAIPYIWVNKTSTTSTTRNMVYLYVDFLLHNMLKMYILPSSVYVSVLNVLIFCNVAYFHKNIYTIYGHFYPMSLFRCWMSSQEIILLTDWYLYIVFCCLALSSSDIKSQIVWFDSLHLITKDFEGIMLSRKQDSDVVFLFSR